MEYRWAVGEGQRGILSRGMGWGCIDKPPLKPGVRRGSQTWGDWEVMRPPSKSSALTSLGGVAGVEQRDRVRGLALTKQLCV